jgi:hypothetical protein
LGKREGGHEPEWSQIKVKLADPNLTVETLESLIREFVATAKSGDHFEKGYPTSAYGMSKVLFVYACCVCPSEKMRSLFFVRFL